MIKDIAEYWSSTRNANGPKEWENHGLNILVKNDGPNFVDNYIVPKKKIKN